MMLYVLIIVTSTYAQTVATYPNALICAQVLIQMNATLSRPPRPVLASVMCVPTLVMPEMRMTPPVAAKPEPQA